ncbi:MAG: hypothetical protein JSU72_11940 [Deltaproteobacteria bacterium]|nr:MAG: hypothetical protein JSU72_11940 [Deltaproteobacteria bacterium]
MSQQRLLAKPVLVFCLAISLVLAAGCATTQPKTSSRPASTESSQKGETEGTARMSEAELQSQVMSFADRFVAIMENAFAEFEDTSPSPESRRAVQLYTVFPQASAYIIAAESDPRVALLDMVVMITLGRMVYEEVGLKELGSELEPVLKGFRTAEEDIWAIARQVLTPDEQKELYGLIQEWRQEHPEVILFSHIRFSDFAAERRTSKLTRGAQARGLFKSVEKATQEAEEIRLLAERGMFLATRLPLMTGAFADVWASRLASNPKVKQLLTDVHRVSMVSERLAYSTDELSNQITKERKATVDQVMEEVSQLREVTIDQVMKKVAVERSAAIDQFVDRLAEERKRTIDEFIAEEQRMRGLLTDLRQTLTVGNELVGTANTLAARLNLGEKGTSSEPFDIKDYQATLVQASTAMQQLEVILRSFDQLMLSPGWEQNLPRMVEAITQVRAQGDEWVTHAFLLGILLILFLLMGAVVAMLSYRFAARRLFGPQGEPGSH